MVRALLGGTKTQTRRIVNVANAATSYLELFYAINAKTPPGSNPWVWVVEFRRVQ